MTASGDASLLHDETVEHRGRRTSLTLERVSTLASGLVFVSIATAMTLAATVLIIPVLGTEIVGFDFRGTLWDPAIAIRNGVSPYPEPVRAEIAVGNPALYPPLLMLLAVPLTLLPWSVGLAVWTVFGMAAIVGALAALNVRDPRCYVIALVSLPVVAGLQWGNATLLLVPLVALAWRWRDSWARSGALVGLAIASKLILWPLVIWLLATRRYRAACLAGGSTTAFIVVPWGVIGFDGLTAYPDVLRVAEKVYATHSFSVATVFAGLGFGSVQATLIALSVGVAVTSLAFVAGRAGADTVSIALAVFAATLGSPIVWQYYYALLLVPIAIVRPRFSGLWTALGLFYLARLLPRESLTLADVAPTGSLPRPHGIPSAIWIFNNSPPALWPALGYLAVACLAITSIVVSAHGASAPTAWRRTIPHRAT